MEFIFNAVRHLGAHVTVLKFVSAMMSIATCATSCIAMGDEGTILALANATCLYILVYDLKAMVV